MSRLIIRQVKMNDSAEFSCLAENSYGRANTTIVLIVEVSLTINDNTIRDFYNCKTRQYFREILLTKIKMFYITIPALRAFEKILQNSVDLF